MLSKECLNVKHELRYTWRLMWNTWNAPREKIACERTHTMSLGCTVALSLGFILNSRSDNFLQKSTVDGRIEPEVTTPNEMLRQQSPSSVRKLVPDHNALSGSQRRLTVHADRQIQICGFSPSSVIHELLEFQESQDSLVWYPGTRNHRIWQNEDFEFFFCDLHCGDSHRLCRIRVAASFTMTLLIAFSEIPSAYDAFVAPRVSIELLPWLVAKEFHIRLKVEMTPQPSKCCHVIVFELTWRSIGPNYAASNFRMADKEVRKLWWSSDGQNGLYIMIHVASKFLIVNLDTFDETFSSHFKGVKCVCLHLSSFRCQQPLTTKWTVGYGRLKVE